MSENTNRSRVDEMLKQVQAEVERDEMALQDAMGATEQSSKITKSEL